MTSQFIPPEFLPVPVPKQWSDHQVSLKDSRPIRPLSSPNPGPLENVENPTRFRSSFECQCGANPLNDPHNLAVAAGVYTPLTHQFPEHRLLSSNHSAASILQARSLFDLLPSPVQSLLASPRIVDNLRHVTSTDPASHLRPLLSEHFPDNIAPDRSATHAKRGYRLHQNDQYTADDWDGWNALHREEQVLRNPAPHVKSRRDNMRDVPLSERPSGPTASLGTYHPALPSSHHFALQDPTDRKAMTYFPSPEADPLCWCGTRTPRVSHSVHVYFAFVGRTVMRAVEIPTQPWQEPVLGQHYVWEYGIPMRLVSEASYALWQIMTQQTLGLDAANHS